MAWPAAVHLLVLAGLPHATGVNILCSAVLLGVVKSSSPALSGKALTLSVHDVCLRANFAAGLMRLSQPADLW